MKRRFKPILPVIILLCTFVSGQWLAFSHTHTGAFDEEVHTGSAKNAVHLNTHCPVCDQLAHYHLSFDPEPVRAASSGTAVIWAEAVFTPVFPVSFSGADRAPPLS